MTAVLSVEHFTLAVPTDSAVSGTLTELTTSTNLDHCVPFVTHKVSSTGMGSDSGATQVDVWFVGSPDRVMVKRDVDAGEIEVEITVVEFDPARVNVYGGGEGSDGQDQAVGREGKWWLPSDPGGDNYTVDLSAYPGGSISVVVANSFMVTHAYCDGGDSTVEAHLFRSRITGTQELQIDRGNYGGTADGHWFLVESISGDDFTVEAMGLQLTDGGAAGFTTNTAVTAAAADLDTMFLIGSYLQNGNGDENENSTVNITLTEDLVTILRADDTGVLDWSGFLVTMTDGTTVQRGVEVDADDAVPITITEVTIAESMAILEGATGSMNGGSFQGATAAHRPDSVVELNLPGATTTTTLNMERDISASDPGNDISWEVIEWGTGGAPPATRRVMVIS